MAGPSACKCEPIYMREMMERLGIEPGGGRGAKPEPKLHRRVSSLRNVPVQTSLPRLARPDAGVGGVRPALLPEC